MGFELVFTGEAEAVIEKLQSQGPEVKLRKVQKALGLLERDPRYPSLNSHKYASMRGLQGEEVWDSYVENKTPAAWRVFWHYGPGKDVITVLTITPHP